MSQNDYVIANQTTPLFRADLNLALQALASNSSGSSAPSTTYANMLWYDTANNTLKMRSEADDAWITLGTLDQSLNTFTPAGLVGTSADADFTVDPTLLATRATIETLVSSSTLFDTFVYDFDIDGTVTNLNFTGLSAYNTIEFDICIQLSGSSQPLVQLSADGTTYITSGYVGASIDGVSSSSASSGLLTNRSSDPDIAGFGKILGFADAATETTLHGTFGGSSSSRCINAYTRKTGQTAHQAFRIAFGAATSGGRVTVRGFKDA